LLTTNENLLAFYELTLQKITDDLNKEKTYIDKKDEKNFIKTKNHFARIWSSNIVQEK